MADKSWKRDERLICGLFGGSRRGPDGFGQTDCINSVMGVQIKRSSRGSILTRWVEDAKEQAQKEDKPWVLVVRKPRTHIGSSTATVQLSFLLDLLMESGRLCAQHATQPTEQPSDSAQTVPEK